MLTKYVKPFLLTLACLIAATPLSARIIEVTGIVTDSSNGEPYAGVSVYDKNVKLPDGDYKHLGTTDVVGRFLVSVDDDGELLFRGMNDEEVSQKVKGRMELNVAIKRVAKQLKQVEVTEKRNRKAATIEDTDIELDGNWAKFRTSLTLGKDMLKSNRRFILQNVIRDSKVENGEMKDTIYYGRPIVFDCDEYAVTTERMLDGDMSHDPLRPYVHRLHPDSIGNQVVFELDSIFIDPVPTNNDIRVIQYSWGVDYDHLVYFQTKQTGQGTTNPMRFFEFSGHGAYIPANSWIIPGISKQNLATEVEMNMQFLVNSPRIDFDDPATAQSMENLIKDLQDIEAGRSTRLKSFGLTVTSSPEGSYEGNLNLAKRRAQEAVKTVTGNLSSGTRKSVDLTEQNAKVAPWSALVPLLRADSLYQLADTVQGICNLYPGDDGMAITQQGRAIARLPEYTSVIKNYLPKLRRVTYSFVTEIYRELTDAELLEYADEDINKIQDPRELWRLEHLVDSLPKKERVLQYAYDRVTRNNQGYPIRSLFANDLAATRIDMGKYNEHWLQEFVDSLPKRGPMPNEIITNHAITKIKRNDSKGFVEAANLLVELPDTGYIHKVNIYAFALTGDYREVLDEIGAESPTNEVIILLRYKENREAYEKSKKLGGSAREEYIKAMCAHRLSIDNGDDEVAFDEAVQHLANALRLDPKLEEIAMVDKDVLEMLQPAKDKISQDLIAEQAAADNAAAEIALMVSEIESEMENAQLEAEAEMESLELPESEVKAAGELAAIEARDAGIAKKAEEAKQQALSDGLTEEEADAVAARRAQDLRNAFAVRSADKAKASTRRTTTRSQADIDAERQAMEEAEAEAAAEEAAAKKAAEEAAKKAAENSGDDETPATEN